MENSFWAINFLTRSGGRKDLEEAMFDYHLQDHKNVRTFYFFFFNIRFINKNN